MRAQSDKLPSWLILAFGLLIVAAPLAAPREAYALKYLIWVAALFLLGASFVSKPKVPLKFSPLVILLLLATVTAAVQLLPLPTEWLGLLSPYAADHYAKGGIERNYLPITLDGAATWEFFHVACVLLMLALWRSNYATHISNLRTVEYAVIVSAVVQALYGSLAVVSGAEVGAYLQAKEAYLGSATGSFVNRSMFGLYLNLGLVACLRLLLFSRRPLSGYALLSLRLAMVILVIGVTLSHSRAVGLGFIGIMVVAFVAVLVTRTQRKKKNLPGLLMLLASILLIDLLVVSKWYGLERLTERAAATSVESEQRDDIAELLVEHYQVTSAPLGFGLGSFEAVYPNIEENYVRGRYVRAHSDIVELVVSVGLLAVPLIAIFLWLLVTGGVSGVLLGAALLPHIVLDFAASNWLICFVFILLWKKRQTTNAVL